MIGSRLRNRRNQRTITVKSKAISSGKYTESNVLTGQIATWEPFKLIDSNTEIITDAGNVVVATDVFWFSGNPAITESHVLVNEDDSTRYEVIRLDNQGGNGNRLKVITRRI